MFAVQVLFAKHLAILKLGKAFVFQPGQHFLKLLKLLIFIYSQVHCCNNITDLSQGS